MRKHIIEFANDETLQKKVYGEDLWIDDLNPTFLESEIYRAKPDDPKGYIKADNDMTVESKNNQERFRTDLEKLINKYSVENNSNTPDYILADYLIECLHNLDKVINKRASWYGFKET